MSDTGQNQRSAEANANDSPFDSLYKTQENT
jgi:hypothetical protein